MITNVTIIAKYMSWECNDKLLCFTHSLDGEAANAGFTCIDKYSGGNRVYQNQLWSTAVEDLNPVYKDDLFRILHDKSTDCYLYEQEGDYPARVYYLYGFGWKRVSEDPCD